MDELRRNERLRRLEQALISPPATLDAERRRIDAMIERARRIRAAELDRRDEVLRRGRRGRRRPGDQLDLGGVPVEPNRPGGLSGGAAAALEFGTTLSAEAGEPRERVGASASPARSLPMSALPELPTQAFAKQDATPDLDFYAPPRLVTHIDEDAVAALTAYYRELIPPGSDVLDLMSSWISHLPDDLALNSVVGHGMNRQELAANPRLTRRFIQDLNADPLLPLADDSLDAALCCVGVQYLQRPVEVFAEVARALRPGAPFAVSYSNRCFPTKAVAIWRALDLGGQAELIRLYMTRAGFATLDTRVLADGAASDPLVVVTGRQEA